MYYNFGNPYWSDKLKAEFLQRRIIVASIQYYELDGSVISDFDYERISKQYLELVSNMNIRELERTQYWYCFKNYDGSTGFDLYHKLNRKDKSYLMQIAKVVKKLGGKHGK